MFETIVIVISVIVVIGGGVLAWWLENGPGRNNSGDSEISNKKAD